MQDQVVLELFVGQGIDQWIEWIVDLDEMVEFYGCFCVVVVVGNVGIVLQVQLGWLGGLL